MKVHSVIDIITNSSTEIFIEPYSVAPIVELFEKVGAKVVSVVIEDSKEWLETQTKIYGHTGNFEEFLKRKKEEMAKYGNDTGYQTIYVVLENGERVNIKKYFEDAFEIYSEESY